MNTFKERFELFEKHTMGDITDPKQKARLKQAFWMGALELIRLQISVTETMSDDGIKAVTKEIFKEINEGALESIMDVMRANGIHVQLISVDDIFNTKKAPETQA